MKDYAPPVNSSEFVVCKINDNLSVKMTANHQMAINRLPGNCNIFLLVERSFKLTRGREGRMKMLKLEARNFRNPSC